MQGDQPSSPQWRGSDRRRGPERRLGEERREEIRYEPAKDNRRSGKERRGNNRWGDVPSH